MVAVKLSTVLPLRLELEIYAIKVDNTSSIIECMSESRKNPKILTPQAMAAKVLRCVVVAIDSGEESMNALRWALDNLKFHSEEPVGTLVILHVQSPPSILAGVSPGAIPFGGPSYGEVPAFAAAIEAHQKRISEAIVKHALKICEEKKAEMDIKTRVVVGDPKEVICQVADEFKADLLVMGSRSHGPIKRMFLGSVSNYCTNQAQCPVMVVKGSC